MVALALGALCLAAIAGGAWLVGSLLLPSGLCRGRVEEIAVGGALGLVVVGQLDFLLRLCGSRLSPAALALLVAAALIAAAARSVRRRVAVAAGAGSALASAVHTGAVPASASPASARIGPVTASPVSASPVSAPAVAGPALAAAGSSRAAATPERPAGRRAPLVRLAMLLIAGGAPLVLLALYPPIDPDPGLYHLPFARGFVESRGLPFFASLRFPVFPQHSELLFAIGLRLHGTTGAQLVEVAMALFTALLLWLWGRDVGGEMAGLIAAALWLGNPMVILLGSTAHVDVGLACFVLAGLYCLERARRDGRAAWPVLAGAFLGAAAAVKYLGLFFLAAGTAAMALRPRRRHAVRFALVALVVALPVYAHILRLTGNPIFPFIPQVFGFTEWTHDTSLRPEQVRPIPVPWNGATLAALLRFPAQRAAALLEGGAGKLDQLVRADRDPPHIRVLRRMPDWGRAAVLLTLAVAWARGLWRPPLRLAVTVALSSLLLWLSTLEDVHRLDPRYILAAGPPLALATGAFIAELAAGLGRLAPRLARVRLLPTAAVVASGLVALLPGLVYAGIRCRFLGPLPFDAAARAAVQRSHLPGFAALQDAGRRHGGDSAVYGLHLASLAYYAPGRYLGDWFGPARYAKLDRSFGSGEALFLALRRLGADHFLAPRGTLASLPRDAGFAGHFRVEHADEGAVLWELQPLPGARAQAAHPLQAQVRRAPR